MPAHVSNQAFIIHHQDYSNSSKILYCLTRKEGMVAMLAKGCKRRKSPFFADCQPFRLLELQWIKKSGLSLLTASQTLSVVNLQQSKKQFCAFYINELYYRLLKQGQADEALFMLYLHTFDQLQDQDDIERTLRLFESRFIKLLGYDYAALIESLDPNHSLYCFDALHFRFYPHKGAASQMFYYRELAEFAQQHYSEQNRLSYKRFNRMIIQQLLDGKPLKSRELFL